MKIIITKPVEYEACLLEVDAHIRYPEDTSYMGQDGEYHDCDPDNPECPCFDGHQWKPIINLNTGKIINWDKEINCHVFGKVCDEFKCIIKGINGEHLIEYEGYVPSFMAIEDAGYGDYIDMIVLEDGTIKNWYFTNNDVNYLLEQDLN